VHVLRKMVEAVRPGGLVLDLQVIRPNPVVEAGGVALCDIDGEPLFRKADAAAAAVDSFIAAGLLREEAADDHDVRKHYPSGAAVVDWYLDDARRIQDEAIPRLLRVTSPCAVRERCRLRRLRVVPFVTQAT
jgi:hypothetical protein